MHKRGGRRPEVLFHKSLSWNLQKDTKKSFSQSNSLNSWITLPETNVAPENWWLQDVFPIEIVRFQVLC